MKRVRYKHNPKANSNPSSGENVFLLDIGLRGVAEEHQRNRHPIQRSSLRYESGFKNLQAEGRPP